jgi:hypothetical protein
MSKVLLRQCSDLLALAARSIIRIKVLDRRLAVDSRQEERG